MPSTRHIDLDDHILAFIMATDLSEPSSVSNVPGGIVSQGADDVSPLEQDLLDEYERLADNMKKVSPRKPST
jgi:hypothetical protein